MKQQTAAVLRELKQRPMTSGDITRMGIRNAPDVIYQLRKQYGGQSIETEIVTVRTRWGKSRVARYRWAA